MHITLAIEGWPKFLILNNRRKDEPTAFMEEVIANLFPHIEVWERGSQPGFSEADMWNEDIELNLIPKVTKLWPAHTLYPALPEPCQALCLAQALLSPASRASRRRLRQAAGVHLPQVLERADAILRSCTEYGRPFPLSLEFALKEVLNTAKLPEDSLLLEFPATASPEFLARNRNLLNPA
jgi:hypothetical protein